MCNIHDGISQSTEESSTQVSTINLDLMLGELSVRDFSAWFIHKLDDVIEKKLLTRLRV